MLVVRSTRLSAPPLVRRVHTADVVTLRETVRKLDYDNYATGLLYPQETRPAFFAIRALNGEIASIKDTVGTNPATGKIRMQWWRERIYDMYSPDGRAPQDTMVLRVLSDAVQQHTLTRRWFERLIDARDEDLDTDQPQTLRDLERYADRTATSLLYLSLELLGVRDPIADTAAGHAGVAIGLTTLLRGTPYHISRNQLYLPEDLLVTHEISNVDFVAATENPAAGTKLAPVIFDVACRALEHLRAAQSMRGELPTAARPALRALVPTSMYLTALEAANFNVFDPSLRSPNPVDVHLALLKAYMLRRY